MYCTRWQYRFDSRLYYQIFTRKMPLTFLCLIVVFRVSHNLVLLRSASGIFNQ